MKAFAVRHDALGLVGLVAASPLDYNRLVARFRHKLDPEMTAAGVIKLEYGSDTADLYREHALTPELPMVIVLNASSMKVTGETLEEIKQHYAEKSAGMLEPEVASAIESLASEIWDRVRPGGVLVRDPRSVDLADCWDRYVTVLLRGDNVSEDLARLVSGEASSAFYRMWAANRYDDLRCFDGVDYLKRMLGMTYIACTNR